MDLLISVVTEDEVAAALEGGADIVDVKNPAEGTLGANFPWVLRRVRAVTPEGVPVSAALGDVPDLPGTIALAALGAATCGLQYVKVGLMGPRQAANALHLLRCVCQAVGEFSARTEVIASAYADAHRVDAFPPLALPSVAAAAGASGCLLDTALKAGDNLFAHLDDGQLAHFVQECRHLGLLSALAGSLTAADVPRLRAIGPDIIGFRTAACRGDRTHGRIDAHKVRQLKSLLDTP
jgi:(5-formylfuran-3-yl)methyl phosphate synthase